MVTPRQKLEAERQELLSRLGQVNALVDAMNLLETHGIPVGPPVDAAESALMQRVRAVVKGLSPIVFTVRDVMNNMSDSASRMTVRAGLNELVQDGLIHVVRQGSRGRAAEYRSANGEMEENENGPEVGSSP